MSGEPLDAVTGMRRSEIEAALRIVRLETQGAIREEWRTTMDAVTNGAQASILTSNILHGNTEIGLPGFIPVMERWRDDMDDWRREKDRVDDERYREMQREFTTIKARQSVIRRSVLKVGELVRPLILSQWKLMMAAAIAWIITHLPISWSVKRFLVWLSSLLTQHAK